MNSKIRDRVFYGGMIIASLAAGFVMLTGRLDWCPWITLAIFMHMCILIALDTFLQFRKYR